MLEVLHEDEFKRRLMEGMRLDKKKNVSDLNSVVSVKAKQTRTSRLRPRFSSLFLLGSVSLCCISIKCLFPCCCTERVQPSACGSQVRQDGSGEPPAAEESLARRCRKGKKKKERLRASSSNTPQSRLLSEDSSKMAEF